MNCFFRHDWIHGKRMTGITNKGKNLRYYGERICRKCGKIQENNPYVDTSFGGEELINRWATIGYSKKTHNTGGTK